MLPPCGIKRTKLEVSILKKGQCTKKIVSSTTLIIIYYPVKLLQQKLTQMSVESQKAEILL